ncbi:MAG TPA: hypothetical protein V6D29_00370 [Leptolyngbyaceae cyanobacterium]
MTNGSTDRLDRIEVILAQLAESQQRTQQQIEANSIGMAQMREEMQLADERSRERLEETTADVVEMISNLGLQIGETRAIADSNARAVQAWEASAEERRAETTSMTSELRQQQVETDQRFNVLLEEARVDRQEWRQKFDEWQQKFDEQLAEMRAGREEWQQQAAANETEHRAFRQNIQVLLAEIARIWQHLAG